MNHISFVVEDLAKRGKFKETLIWLPGNSTKAKNMGVDKKSET